MATGDSPEKLPYEQRLRGELIAAATRQRNKARQAMGGLIKKKTRLPGVSLQQLESVRKADMKVVSAIGPVVPRVDASDYRLGFGKKVVTWHKDIGMEDAIGLHGEVAVCLQRTEKLRFGSVRSTENLAFIAIFADSMPQNATADSAFEAVMVLDVQRGVFWYEQSCGEAFDMANHPVAQHYQLLPDDLVVPAFQFGSMIRAAEDAGRGKIPVTFPTQ